MEPGELNSTHTYSKAAKAQLFKSGKRWQRTRFAPQKIKFGTSGHVTGFNPIPWLPRIYDQSTLGRKQHMQNLIGTQKKTSLLLFCRLSFIIISKPPLQVRECKIKLLHSSKKKKDFTTLQLAECLHSTVEDFLKMFVNSSVYVS